LSKRFLKHGWFALGVLLLVALVVFPACSGGGGGGGGGGSSLLLRVANTDIFTEPWNPVAGSNWIYDRFPQDATQDLGVVPDPNTGLYVPWRIDHAEVTVQTGLPVGVTSPNDSWLNLSFAATINVPATAYADWNADTQTWIPAGTGVTAKTKTVVYYPKSIFDDLYQDGSNLTAADFMLYAIMIFDRAKPDSDIYDPNYVSEFGAFLDHFKGVTFDFSNPSWGLVVTTYDDLWYFDAELIVGGNSWYPVSPYGEYNFESVSLGIMSERDGQLAFSKAKSTDNSVEYMNFIGGPSLNILAGHLSDAQNSAKADYEFIPYEPTLGTYITAAQALTRYQNLQTFYNSHHVFWVGTGPYYVNTVNLSGKVLDLKKWHNYNGSSTQFFSYMTPVPTTPYPTNTGGWLDEIVMSVVGTDAAAITELANNDLDVYAYPMTDATLKATVDANAALKTYDAAGSFDEFTMNPSANATYPFFTGTGKLNPFAVPNVREALNLAIDRTYLCNDILGGLGLPRFTAIGAASTDATKFATELAAVAANYSYDMTTASSEIQTAMLGISSNVTYTGGKYYYDYGSGPELVAVKVLIRSDGHERLDFGNYLVTQLNTLGFTATAQYGTSSDLSPIWRGNPALGLWNVYTGGWIQTAISLDEGSNFGAFYTPLWSAMGPLWAAYTPTPTFLDVCTKLWYNDFNTIAERTALFDQAIPLSMHDSVRIWLCDLLAFQPVRANVAVASDTAGGISGCYMWAASIHFQSATGVPLAPLDTGA
jgi:hypothetical protein